MITSKQIMGARGMLGWSAKKLAEMSGLGIATIQRMERRGPADSTAGNVEAVENALKDADIVFNLDEGTGPGVRMRE